MKSGAGVGSHSRKKKSSWITENKQWNHLQWIRNSFSHKTSPNEFSFSLFRHHWHGEEKKS
jgi:hypothetical protein